MKPRDESLLETWGWDDGWFQVWTEGRYDGEPARVVAVDRGSLLLQGASGAGRAVVASSVVAQVVPTVGDWCAVTIETGSWRVQACLPRRSALRRRAAGRATLAQDLAANMDTAFLVCGLDRDQGLRSLERLLTIVYDGGVAPVVVLNKVDQCPDVADAVQSAMFSAPRVPVAPVSALGGEGLDALAGHLRAGLTVVLLGPSGVGKSTLVNALAGTWEQEITATGSVRPGDRRGRHTTTRRQIHLLPGGALLLDTPGLRELGAWIESDGLAQTFPDIHALAQGCRFSDCRHEEEPGCAVREALLGGELDAQRFHRFLELTEEAESLEARRSERGRSGTKRQAKMLSKTIRRFYKEKKGR
jgi:ribosome biogenesis GTPase